MLKEDNQISKLNRSKYWRTIFHLFQGNDQEVFPGATNLRPKNFLHGFTGYSKQNI
jgi:hypothetical protein